MGNNIVELNEIFMERWTRCILLVYWEDKGAFIFIWNKAALQGIIVVFSNRGRVEGYHALLSFSQQTKCVKNKQEHDS